MVQGKKQLNSKPKFAEVVIGAGRTHQNAFASKSFDR